MGKRLNNLLVWGMLGASSLGLTVFNDRYDNVPKRATAEQKANLRNAVPKTDVREKNANDVRINLDEFPEFDPKARPTEGLEAPSFYKKVSDSPRQILNEIKHYQNKPLQDCDNPTEQEYLNTPSEPVQNQPQPPILKRYERFA